MNYKLFTDGGARGNPGPGAIGIVLIDSEGNKISQLGKYLGISTNNEAEYAALVEGLKLASEKEVQNIKCFLDSELVVKQLNGLYKVKNARLLEFYKAVKELEGNFADITYQHIPREKNSEADALVNQVLDSVPNLA